MKPRKKKKSKYDRLIKIFSIIMVITMLIGIILSLVFSFMRY
ncbi:DUF4044 domain-containing protein [Facklamia miroungae]|nr:DUF4044 domain-containing protein [Facklamia miroungae]